MHRIAVVVLLLLFGATSGFAQQTPLIPDSLSLAHALQLAQENHPVYGVQRATLEAADAQERTTAWWLTLLPTINLSSSMVTTQSRVLTGTDEFGRPVRLDDPISFRRTDSDFGPSFGQITIFDGGVGIRNSRSTRASIRGRRAAVAAEAIQFEGQLVRSYYSAVQAERQVELETRLLESALLNFEAAERLLRVGSQDPLDLLGAELAVAEAEGRLERARGDARRARLTLADGMGLPRETEFNLSDELPEVFDPAALDLERIVATAMHASPAIAQVEASAEQTRYELANARFNRLPTVNAYLSTRRGSTLGAGSDPLFYLNPLNQTYTLGLNVSFSLFDRFQSSSRVSQARAGQAAASENLRLSRLQTESEIRSAAIDLQNVYRTLGILDRTSDLSRQQMEMAQEKYRLGLLTFRELQASFDSAYQAEYNALSARFDFVTALLALEGAAGTAVR